MLLAAGVALASGCTNKQGETESPVFITVDIALQPGFIDVASTTPVQINTITLRFQVDHERQIGDWARWARDQIADWHSPTDPGPWDYRRVFTRAG